MFKFPSFKRNTTVETPPERYSQENINALQQSIIAGLDVASLRSAIDQAGDRDETSCLIPFTHDDAGVHARDVMRSLVGDNEAHWFKTKMNDWLLETLGGSLKLTYAGEPMVSWDAETLASIRNSKPQLGRTLGGDPMNGDET